MQVKGSHDPSIAAQFNKPIAQSGSKSFLFSKGKASLNFSVPSAAGCSGALMPLTVSCNNASTKKIVGITAKIVEVVMHKADDGHTRVSRVSHKVRLDNSAVASKGGAFEVSTQIQVSVPFFVWTNTLLIAHCTDPGEQVYAVV